jgi:hypothetical protein
MTRDEKIAWKQKYVSYLEANGYVPSTEPNPEEPDMVYEEWVKPDKDGGLPFVVALAISHSDTDPPFATMWF